MINILNSFEKRKLLIFEIVLNSFMIFLQVLIFFSYDIFLTFHWWYNILMRVFFVLSFLVFGFCCLLLYKMLRNRKIFLGCVLLQCIGAGLSIYYHADYLYWYDESFPDRFMLFSYLIFTFISFCLAYIFIKIKPDWVSRFQAYTLKRKLKIKLSFDLDNYEYIKAQAKKENKTIKHFLQDTVICTINNKEGHND